MYKINSPDAVLHETASQEEGGKGPQRKFRDWDEQQKQRLQLQQQLEQMYHDHQMMPLQLGHEQMPYSSSFLVVLNKWNMLFVHHTFVIITKKKSTNGTYQCSDKDTLCDS
jgi:hypothetical protein